MPTPNVYLNIPVPAANGAGAAVDVSLMGKSKTLIVGGVFKATVKFEFANDPAGTVWTPLAASFEAPDTQNVDVAARFMRAVVSNYKSGAPNADVGSSNAGTSFAQLVPPPGNGAGAAVDISALPPFKTVVISGGFTGGLFVEISEDGVGWFPALAFYTGGDQNFTAYAQFARISRSNSGGGVPNVWVGGAADEPGVGQPAFAVSTTTIYARLTGSDTSGSGTLTNPYRTFQRAIRDVPHVIPPGGRYVVDITGIGVENLPADYEFPVIKNPHYFELSFTDPNFPSKQGFEVRATPQLASNIPPADALVSAPDVLSMVNDPDTDNVTITLNVARASWGANALSGKQIRSATGLSAFFNTGTIWESDTTTIKIAFRGALGALPTLPIEIVEPSATLSGSGVGSGQAVTIADCYVFGLKGIKFVDTGGAATDLSLGIFGAAVAFLEMCDVAGLASELGSLATTACFLHDKNFSSFGPGLKFLGRTYLRGIPSFTQAVSAPATWEILGSVFENCPSIGPRRGGLVPIGLNHPFNLTMRGSQILSPHVDGAFAANGVALASGSNRMSRVKISGCPANAVFAGEANGFLEMFDVVGGTGAAGDPVNVGFGVLVNDGSVVRVKDDGTLVTGGGGDMKVGTLAARTWADFRTALPGPAPSGKGIKNEYDLITLNAGGFEVGDEVTGAGTGGVSGSRLYQRP